MDDPGKPSLLTRLLGPKKRDRRPRPHPYAHERSTEAELAVDPRRVTWLWLGGSTALMVLGLLLALRYSPHGAEAPGWIATPIGWFLWLLGGPGPASPRWEQWTLVPLFTGLALLGFGFNRETWSKRLTMAGWVLFGFYWGLSAIDLFVSEGQDFVNFTFALVGVYFFSYLAYQQWLSLVRGVQNDAVHFLNVTAFIAAGTYFVVAKIQFLRVWLINVVGEHTKWMLDLFGQGEKKNIQFIVDKQDSQGPVTFFYPDKYCDPYRGDGVGAYCAELSGSDRFVTTIPEPSGWWDQLMFYNAGAGVEQVVPVSIILACTAIQSIMLFVGLFFGTQAPLRKKVKFSLIVGAIIYVLNLVRNTGIIWFYGQGEASFWVMHNAIGKGGSLLAMIGIAFAVFKWFPEFFKALVSVLDLPDRDGPIERHLKIGRRRPETGAKPTADAA